MIHAEPQAPRLLAVQPSGVVVVAPGSKAPLVAGATDAAYSPDGTLVAFVRGGDLWVANSDGSGPRRLVATPNVVEASPAWLPDGSAIVYSAAVDGSRQLRVVPLPDGLSRRIAASGGEDYSPAVSRQGRLAFVSTRGGAPQIFVSQPNGSGATPFDTTPPATPFADVRDLAWSPDGKLLAYTAVEADGATDVVVDNGNAQLIGPPGHQPVWSPSGARIAFADASGLETMAANATDVVRVGSGMPVDWRVVPVGAPLFPNLVMRPPSGLVTMRAANGRWLLGYTSMVDNDGPGILWIEGRRPKGATYMNVRQLVELKGGGTRVDPQSGELHYVVAPPHYHWHMLGFVRAELDTAGTFTVRVRDHKSGFCIADHYGTAVGVPHGPPRFLGDCEQFHPEATFVSEGASVGYTDRYPAFFHGQQLDLTGLPAGRYWLVHRANSDLHLREMRYDDDVAATLIRLAWRSGVPSVTELRTCLAAAHC